MQKTIIVYIAETESIGILANINCDAANLCKLVRVSHAKLKTTYD